MNQVTCLSVHQRYWILQIHFAWMLIKRRNRERKRASLSSHTDVYEQCNLITLQAVCHSNPAITKFQPVLTARHEKSFAASLSQPFADVVTHADVGHREQA